MQLSQFDTNNIQQDVDLAIEELTKAILASNNEKDSRNKLI